MIRLFGYAAAFLLLTLSLALVTRSWLLRLLAVATGLAIIGLYVFLLLRRPARRGTLAADELQEPVEICWDEQGQPHIQARTLHDLYFAQGYVTAQDRLWHMELCRRAAAGRLSELFGERLLDRDRHLRCLGLHRAARESLPLCTEAGRAALEAYAAGVNAFIAEGRLPLAFAAARLKPDAWSAVDSLAVAKLAAYELSPSWGDPLFQMQLAQAAGGDMVAALFGQGCAETAVDLAPLAGLAFARPLTVCGASAWALSGQRTRSGLPILGSALETAPRVPAPVYPVRLTGPGRLDLSGSTLPGVPGLFTGESAHFAWGFAVAAAEPPQLVPVSAEELQGAERRVEQIRVRGRREPVALEVLTTPQGPVLACDAQGGVALRSAVLQPSTEVEALLRLNRAQSLPEFRASLAAWTAPPLEAIYAGADGQIARVQTGSPAESAEPAPEEPPSLLIAAPAYSAERLQEYLGARPRWTREQLEPVMSDTVSLQARRLIQPLLGCLQEGLRQGHQHESLSAAEKQALLLLSDWDCDESTSSAAACLWEQWYHFLAEAIFRPHMGLDLFNQFIGTRSAAPAVDGLILAAAEGRESPWLPLEGEQGLPRLALRSFRRAVALLTAKQGRRMDHWRYGKEHRIRFVHSLPSPVFGHLLSLGPFQFGGSAATLNRSLADPLDPQRAVTATTHARLIDLGLPDEAAAFTVPGVDGHPLGANYASQLAHWLRREPMPRVRRQPEREKLTLNPR